eukprot:CAMPEP_0168421410 /NCGR_PEP_ID=MMETSP0228-20121227/33267_1 /TAXON_ID=133427 /ORGANISM="Protoceratium reticulatum, Strain CCCM 535 (=CCMP 1889)" /LENGTH=174 /DNA_ID=CAMNT_0008435317 /DNA_START=504 /DNA_END=1030 /DNA_ORIENTATION=+
MTHGHGAILGGWIRCSTSLRRSANTVTTPRTSFWRCASGMTSLSEQYASAAAACGSAGPQLPEATCSSSNVNPEALNVLERKRAAGHETLARPAGPGARACRRSPRKSQRRVDLPRTAAWPRQLVEVLVALETVPRQHVPLDVENQLPSPPVAGAGGELPLEPRGAEAREELLQ